MKTGISKAGLFVVRSKVRAQVKTNGFFRPTYLIFIVSAAELRKISNVIQNKKKSVHYQRDL